MPPFVNSHFVLSVYGFDIPGQPLESPSFSAMESISERYSLPIKMIKGVVGTQVDIVADVLSGGTASMCFGVTSASVNRLLHVCCFCFGFRNWR